MELDMKPGDKVIRSEWKKAQLSLLKPDKNK